MLDVRYRDARGRVTDLAAGLTDAQVQTPVPATPGWRVQELLAHVVGGAADAVVGRLDGAPGDGWTARHVGERRDVPIAELLAEWDETGPVVEMGLAGIQFTGPNLAADLLCHEADLHEALGLARVDREHWEQPFLEVMMRSLDRRLRDAGTVLVCDELGREWQLGSGVPSARLRADGYELLRSLFSRRSRRQIAAWDWTPAPTSAIVDSFGFFGTREDDQPVPRV